MLDHLPQVGHGKATPGWLLYLFGVVVDFLSKHGMGLLSATAILVGIGYHLVLIRNANAKHRLDLEEIELRRKYPWNGYPFSKN